MDVFQNSGITPAIILESPLPDVMDWLKAKVDLEHKKAEERKKAEDLARVKQAGAGKSKGGVY